MKENAAAQKLPAMLAMLSDFVNTESPSHDVAALNNCASVIAHAGEQLFNAPAEILTANDRRPHLRWCFGKPAVAIIGHFDTVWPMGTTEQWPFTVNGDHATGPGIFDMKVGIVQAIFALADLDNREGVELLFTADEEIGAPTSRAIIEETAQRVAAVLVVEPSADGALKIARKGNASYNITIAGRAAHAGLEPEQGINAVSELARCIAVIEGLSSPINGTTVTPTMAHGGTAINVVPAQASLAVDIRALTSEELQRVDKQLRALSPVSPSASIHVEGEVRCPPMPPSVSAALFARAQAVAEQLGLPPLQGVTSGGSSDGNITAAMGTPTLDGLGGVGGGAHAENEHVVISSIPARTALLHGLIQDLLTNPPQYA